ncbi:sigma 54-interacting transcriptional regulator [candidate division KSB1 bacterium]|nr:sigma 54-interacting transcriptional regulator [candidate division KSB1 bacterium]
MCQIGLVAKDAQLSEFIGNAIQESVACQVINLDDLQLNPTISHPFHLLLIDWLALEKSPRLAEHFTRINPEATVIVLAAEGYSHRAEVLAALGVEEIIVFHEDKRPAIALLSKKIASLKHLQTLQEKLRREIRQSQIVAKSRVMKELMCRLPLLGACDSTILLTGETGTGKELIARAIHYLGPRAGKPFVTIDCGALPEHLVENELFGHTRGAYSGADSAGVGLIQEADGGTLFLDEVEALPMSTQTKFLRFLQERQYRPLGQSKYQSVDLHVIAATNQNLAQAVSQREFRQDLYYRLEGIKLFLSPLRERKADIPALAYYFLKKHSHDGMPRPSAIPEDLIRNWLNYHWPGNVRELENKILALLMETVGEPIPKQEVFHTSRSGIRPLFEVRNEALTQCDCAYLRELLAFANGNLSAAARLAGIHRKSLAALLKKYGLRGSTTQLRPDQVS